MEGSAGITGRFPQYSNATEVDGLAESLTALTLQPADAAADTDSVDRLTASALPALFADGASDEQGLDGVTAVDLTDTPAAGQPHEDPSLTESVMVGNFFHQIDTASERMQRRLENTEEAEVEGLTNFFAQLDPVEEPASAPAVARTVDWKPYSNLREAVVWQNFQTLLRIAAADAGEIPLWVDKRGLITEDPDGLNEGVFARSYRKLWGQGVSVTDHAIASTFASFENLVQNGKLAKSALGAKGLSVEARNAWSGTMNSAILAIENWQPHQFAVAINKVRAAYATLADKIGDTDAQTYPWQSATPELKTEFFENLAEHLPPPPPAAAPTPPPLPAAPPPSPSSRLVKTPSISKGLLRQTDHTAGDGQPRSGVHGLTPDMLQAFRSGGKAALKLAEHGQEWRQEAERRAEEAKQRAEQAMAQGDQAALGRSVVDFTEAMTNSEEWETDSEPTAAADSKPKKHVSVAQQQEAQRLLAQLLVTSVMARRPAVNGGGKAEAAQDSGDVDAIEHELSASVMSLFDDN